MKSKIPLNIFVCLLYYTCSSQSLSTHYLGGGANNACSFFITDMKMSNKGSCYFTGGYYLDAQIDTFIMSAPIGYGNFFLSKISGGHINYLKYDLNFYENHSNCMAIDDSSNIYIGGRYYGDIILGNDTLPAGPFAIGLFIAKYDSAANLKWAKTFYTGSGNINDIAVTSQGDIYAGGYFGGTLKFDNDSLTSTSNYQEAFICKFNNSGNYQWAIEGHGILQNKFVDAVAADTAGNVYIAGYFTNSITFGSVTINSTVSNNPIGYLVKLSPSGTVLFYKKLESFTFMGNAVVPSDIEVDKNTNDCYVAGQCLGLKVNTVTMLTPYASEFVLKLSANGTPAWAQGVYSPYQIQLAGQKIALHDNMVSLFAEIADSCWLIGSDTLYSDNNNDCVLARFDKQGNFYNVKQMGSDGTDHAVAVDYSPSGELFIAGQALPNISPSFDFSIYPLPHNAINLYPGTNSFIGEYAPFNTGLNSLIPNENNLLVFPNPAHNFLTIEIPNTSSASLAIYDLTGRVLLQRSSLNSKTTIEISSLSNGIYIAEVKNKEGRNVKRKFVKD